MIGLLFRSIILIELSKAIKVNVGGIANSDLRRIMPCLGLRDHACCRLHYYLRTLPHRKLALLVVADIFLCVLPLNISWLRRFFKCGALNLVSCVLAKVILTT
jgi:hypothetical protein